jgi:hypothetical protein
MYEVTINDYTIIKTRDLKIAFQAMRDNANPGDEVLLYLDGKRRHFICRR